MTEAMYTHYVSTRRIASLPAETTSMQMFKQLLAEQKWQFGEKNNPSPTWETSLPGEFLLGE